MCLLERGGTLRQETAHCECLELEGSLSSVIGSAGGFPLGQPLAGQLAPGPSTEPANID